MGVVWQELEACHGEMMAELQSKRGGRTPKRKKQKPESKWMSVLTDVMLGLLSQPSQLWRTVVEQVRPTGGVAGWYGRGQESSLCVGFPTAHRSRD